jgi:hypothetical protein
MGNKTMTNKKIVIIDECRFSRICSALFDSIGYGAEILPATTTLPLNFSTNKFGLIVISYPYGAPLIDQIKEKKIPTIILSDNIDGNLISILNDFENSYCMIKPLDYEKFRFVVQQVMSGELANQRGYHIV